VTPAPVLWFTGLSGSGKSTIAVRVHEELVRRGVEVEYIDGDALREVFPGTGFTRAEMRSTSGGRDTWRRGWRRTG
jgi:adenylylsulfate kinase-like enzyme